MKIVLTFMIIFRMYPSISQETKPVYKLDTSIIAILHTPSFSNTQSYKLSDDKLLLIEELFQKAVDEFNLKRDSSKQCRSRLKSDDYKRQYLPFIKNRDSLVRVKCFYDMGNEFPYWRREEVVVFDRGGFYM